MGRACCGANMEKRMRNKVSVDKSAWLPAHPLADAGPYALGNYGLEAINGRIAPKYLGRARNLRRAWVRICTHLPETTLPGASYDILEFSTAHGAMLELWQALGHRVRGTDFLLPKSVQRKYGAIRPHLMEIFDRSHPNPVAADQPGWGYQPVIESIGVEVDLFDAGQTPYAYADKSVDYICCYQAIEAYAPPDDWGRILAEFCRIARRGIVIGFNPPGRGQETEDHWPNTRAAWEKLRTYDAHGFRNVMFEMEETGRGLHPTACKLMAV